MQTQPMRSAKEVGELAVMRTWRKSVNCNNHLFNTDIKTKIYFFFPLCVLAHSAGRHLTDLVRAYVLDFKCVCVDTFFYLDTFFLKEKGQD